MWKVESKEFVVLRDVIVDETSYLMYRPLLRPEGVTSEKLQNETDILACHNQ